MELLGIDVGGSSIKAAIVDINTGELKIERYRIPIPKSTTPKAITEVIQSMVNHFQWTKIIGCSFSTKIIKGKCIHSGNLDKSWKGV